MTLPPIRDLLPHAGAMVLVDEILEATQDRIVSRVTLRPTSPFLEEGRVPAIVGIEYMAQTIAAYAGLRARAAGQAPRIGFLLGTREMNLEVDAFAVGDELTVEAQHVWGDNLIGSFRCEVRRGTRPLVSALVNVYQGDEVPDP